MIRYTESVVTQGFAVVAAEVGEPGEVAVVRHFANVDLIGLGCISAIDEAIVRTLVRLIVDRRSLGRRAWTTEQRLQRNCRSDGGDSGGAFYKLSSAESRFPGL